MDKATPDSAPASVDSVMARFVRAAHARADWMETGQNRNIAQEAEAELRAEVERLAAQAARTDGAISRDSFSGEQLRAAYEVSTARGYSPEGSEAGIPSTPAAGNFVEWARVWHDTASAIATIAGGDPNLDPKGMIESVQNAAQPSQAPVVQASDVVAGALFDLMGMLTSQDEVCTFSARHDAGPAVEQLRKFAEKRGLSLEPCDVAGWSKRLVPVVQAVQQCPRCEGHGTDPVPGMACCNRPTSTGECCGQPNPEPEPCETCEGRGQVPVQAAQAREYPPLPESDALRAALNARGDRDGQGLDPYWKWGYCAGWTDRVEDERQRAQPLKTIVAQAVQANPGQPQAQTGRDLGALLRRGVEQLRAWHQKSGEWRVNWLPPAGDVEWLEDVDGALAALSTSSEKRHITDGELWGLIHADFPHASGALGPLLSFGEIKAVIERDRASSGATTQAVRMLTDAEAAEVHEAYNNIDEAEGNLLDIGIAKFCAVNAGRTIPADGKIGGA